MRRIALAIMLTLAVAGCRPPAPFPRGSVVCVPEYPDCGPTTTTTEPDAGLIPAIECDRTHCWDPAEP